MRGKLAVINRCMAEPRITPAHAGKTANPKIPKLWRKDHPRACGENWKLVEGRSVRQGSPPRMRGKPSSDKERIYGARITPAHAGKTFIDYLNHAPE